MQPSERLHSEECHFLPVDAQAVGGKRFQVAEFLLRKRRVHHNVGKNGHHFLKVAVQRIERQRGIV